MRSVCQRVCVSVYIPIQYVALMGCPKQIKNYFDFSFVCESGMGNGSVGWAKVLTHLTLLWLLTVMKQELCVSWLCDSPSDFGGFSCLSTAFVACYTRQIQPCVCFKGKWSCHDEMSVCVTPCCCSLSSKGCCFSSKKEREWRRCRTTSALLTISQTLPTRPNRSGVKTQVLRVSWHIVWKTVEKFPVPSCQQKHWIFKGALFEFLFLHDRH